MTSSHDNIIKLVVMAFDGKLFSIFSLVLSVHLLSLYCPAAFSCNHGVL